MTTLNKQPQVPSASLRTGSSTAFGAECAPNFAQDDSVLGRGDGAGPVLRGEIGREGFASGMQGSGNREQARAVREGFASEWLPPFMR
jgi:hypothetical protein